MDKVGADQLVVIEQKRRRAMDTTNNKQTAPHKDGSVKFCTRMDKDVDTHQTLEQCIGANECFSDDPCPLHGQFKGPKNIVEQKSKHLA